MRRLVWFFKRKFFDEISANISKKYSSLYEFFQAVVSDNKTINDAKLDDKIASKLEEAVKTRIKEVSVRIEGKLKLSSYAADGVEVVKKALKKAEKRRKDKKKGQGSQSSQSEEEEEEKN